MTYDELGKSLVADYNKRVGNLKDGFDCPKCLNRGYTCYLHKGDIIQQDCECMTRREVIRAIKRSNADYLLKVHNFDSYIHTESWQDMIFNKAKKFAELDIGFWFVGGQIGSGKTKICISMLNRLLERRKECRYYIWQNLVTELNKLQVDGLGYEDRLEELATISVLYLDDFIREEPTKAEIKTAYRIINARYMATLGGKQLITIISSQRLITDILKIDEAIGSRICELGFEYITSVEYGEPRNWRMKLAREKLKNTII